LVVLTWLRDPFLQMQIAIRDRVREKDAAVEREEVRRFFD
jgi:hypothetical protein